MRNIEICKKCQHYTVHHTAYPDSKAKKLIPYVKHYCQIDEKGLDITRTSVSFKESDVLLDDFVELECPKRCPYRLEHLVIKGDENENNREIAVEDDARICEEVGGAGE